MTFFIHTIYMPYLFKISNNICQATHKYIQLYPINKSFSFNVIFSMEMKKKLPLLPKSLLNCLGYKGPSIAWFIFLKGLHGPIFYVECVGYVVKIIFTYVIIFTWVVWIKYIFSWLNFSCVGPKFLRESTFIYSKTYSLDNYSASRFPTNLDQTLFDLFIIFE